MTDFIFESVMTGICAALAGGVAAAPSRSAPVYR